MSALPLISLWKHAVWEDDRHHQLAFMGRVYGGLLSDWPSTELPAQASSLCHLMSKLAEWEALILLLL